MLLPNEMRLRRLAVAAFLSKVAKHTALIAILTLAGTGGGRAPQFGAVAVLGLVVAAVLAHQAGRALSSPFARALARDRPWPRPPS